MIVTTDQINHYVKHYLEKDQTQSAIMLNGPWGSGKSHYIRENLIPFLSDSANGAYKCILISVYGINSVSEISKNIYLELRIKPILDSIRGTVNCSSEITSGIWGIGKTFFKNIVGTKNIDLNIDEADLKRLYESANLNHTLIILEDIERLSINLIEFLGYVNNLTENDGVKILLVANEEALLEYIAEEPSEEPSNDLFETLAIKAPPKKKLSSKNTPYLKAKEKTIGDTLQFNNNLNSAVENILRKFYSDSFPFKAEEYSKPVSDLLVSIGCKNLRTLIFACQKTSDIIEKLQEHSYEPDFNQKEHILFSIIAFSHKIKFTGDDFSLVNLFPEWDNNSHFSQDLACSKYPLYKFCYDFISDYAFNIEKVKDCFEAYRDFKLYDDNFTFNDPDFEIFYSWASRSEEAVMSSIRNISKKLDNPFSIPFTAYGTLITNLIKLHSILGFDLEPFKLKILSNLKHAGQRVSSTYLLFCINSPENDTEKELMNNFKAEILTILDSAQIPLKRFSYIPEDIREYHNWLLANKDTILYNRHSFISEFDLDKICKMIYQCNAEQIYIFREILDTVYNSTSLKSLCSLDFIIFKGMLQQLSTSHLPVTISDRIILKQIEWLVADIMKIIDKYHES